MAAGSGRRSGKAVHSSPGQRGPAKRGEKQRVRNGDRLRVGKGSEERGERRNRDGAGGKSGGSAATKVGTGAEKKVASRPESGNNRRSGESGGKPEGKSAGRRNGGDLAAVMAGIAGDLNESEERGKNGKQEESGDDSPPSSVRARDLWRETSCWKRQGPVVGGRCSGSQSSGVARPFASSSVWGKRWALREERERRGRTAQEGGEKKTFRIFFYKTF